MKQWLIRRGDLSFSRPMPEQEVIDQIESGIIKPEDEICQASGYWFSIQEVDEVRKHFGDIHLHSMIPGTSEITSTTNTSSVTKVNTPAPIASVRQKKFTAGVINPQASVMQVQHADAGEDALVTKRARAMGWLIALIFFGTLALLWLGSR